jgi:lysozyme family protein
MSYPKGLALVSELEGLRISPQDGSYCGVDRNEYARWQQSKGRVPEWIPSAEGLGAYYFDMFWRPRWCEELVSPADSVWFQACINLPFLIGNQLLQAAVWTWPIDGSIGPKTRQAFTRFHPQELADRLLLAQKAHYVTIKRANGELAGLLNRCRIVEQWLAQGRL